MANRKWFAAADDGDLDYILTHQREMIRKQDSQFLDRTALMFAANRGHVEICEILALGDPNEIGIVNRRGNTALHFAASSGHIFIVNMLAPFEARVRNENGDTALTHAILNGHVEVAKILIPFELDVPGSENKLPLMLAKQAGYTELVRVMEKCPVVPNTKVREFDMHAVAQSSTGLVESSIRQRHMIQDLSPTMSWNSPNTCKEKRDKPIATLAETQLDAAASEHWTETDLSKGLNTSIFSITTPVNSAENSAVGSCAESFHSVRCAYLLNKAKPQSNKVDPVTMHPVLAKSYSIRDSWGPLVGSSYSFIGEEESDCHSLVSRATLLEKANRQLREKNAKHVTTIMELEDKNAVLSSLLETLLKPESYAEEYRLDQSKDESSPGPRVKKREAQPHAGNKNDPITMEESRLIREEIKMLRKENKALRDLLREFVEKFDAYMLSTNFYITN